MKTLYPKLFLLWSSFAALPTTWSQSNVRLERVEMPDLVWNTNIARITLANSADIPVTVTINITAKNHRGIGWDTEHVLAAHDTAVISREFDIPPFPGVVRVALSVKTKGGEQIARWETNSEFALENRRIGVLHPAPPLAKASPVGPLAEEYPALQSGHLHHFVFYYPAHFSYVQKNLAALGERRESSYLRLREILNPTFDDTVAVYLFPDEATKFAYTGHQGQGWAFDHVLVEVADPVHPMDPNHELVHIMTRPLGSPPAMFNEGLAVDLQVDRRWSGYGIDDWSHCFDTAGMLMPLDQLFALEDIGSKGTHPWVTYPEAGSMIELLSKQYGFKKVMAAYGKLKSGDPDADNRAVFQQVFGIELSQFERAWLQSLPTSACKISQALIDEIRAKVTIDTK